VEEEREVGGSCCGCCGYWLKWKGGRDGGGEEFGWRITSWWIGTDTAWFDLLVVKDFGFEQ
jgi:hypothetical protein